jgi:hypothetical protein
MHLFLTQLGRERSALYIYNGIALMVVFFFARIVWGAYSTYHWYFDMWKVTQWNVGKSAGASATLLPRSLSMEFAGAEQLSTWVVAVFVLSNATLNMLNVIWFSKMIQAVMSRQTPDDNGISKRD